MWRDLKRLYRVCHERMFRPRSFRTLLTAATLVVLVPIHAAIIIVLINVQSAQRHKVVSNMRYVTMLTRAALDADVARREADLQSLAAMIGGAAGAAPQLLHSYHETHPEILSLAVIDRGGHVIGQAGASIADETAARLHAAAFAPVAGELGRGIALPPVGPAGGPLLVGLAAVPRASVDAAIAVVAVVRLAGITRLLSSVDGHPAWRLAIADRAGSVLVASDPVLVGRSLAPPLSSVLGAETPVRRAWLGDTEYYVAAIAAASGPWWVVVSIPTTTLDPSWRAEWNWVLLAGVLLVLPLGVNLLLGHHLGRRLVALAEAARAIAHERAPRALQPTAIREFNVVQRTLRIASALMHERANTRARVHEMREVLERAQRMESIGQAMAGVAHDFGNLIFVISGNLEQLHASVGPQLAELHLVEATQRLTQQAKILISLLSYGGQRNWREPKEIDVGANISELDDLFHDVIGGSVRLAITIDRELMRCYLDPILFKSVMCNLVINARNAMPRGGVICITGSNVQLDKAAAAAKGLAAGAHVRVSVSDTGIGVAPELRARIFDPFVTTQQAKGAGLGLSILYGFVKTSGGHVELASEPGEGTTFSMYFPAIAAQRRLDDFDQGRSNSAAHSNG